MNAATLGKHGGFRCCLTVLRYLLGVGRPAQFFPLLLLLLGGGVLETRAADLFISELLINPPGTDSSYEYIEIRGTPNLVLPTNTWLISVEGDAGADPGVVQNAFDLSGKAIGGNGFMVLLQNGSVYLPDPAAAVYANTNSNPGWGSGPSSALRHTGNDSITDLKNPSVTFLLATSTEPVVSGRDLDRNDDGVLDAGNISGWVVHDAVGVLDADGKGDIGYGLVNFRRDTAPGNGAAASGVVVPVSFTPKYIARNGNSTGWQSADWVASDLAGVAPVWTLGAGGDTLPTSLSGLPLDHLGTPNFGAAPAPGVVVIPSPSGIVVNEAGNTDSFSLALNTKPSGPVTVQVTSGPLLQISTNQGVSFRTNATLVFTDTTSQKLHVRAVDDDIIDTSPHPAVMHTAILASQDLVQYPLSSLTPNISVAITENDSVLLNEVDINPPGTNDAPYEYVEVRGRPGVSLRSVQMLGIDGENNPGKVLFSIDLSGGRIGGDGLLLVSSPNYPLLPARLDGVFAEAQFDLAGGILPNGAFTLLLVTSPTPILPGLGLDPGKAGTLTELPAGTTILDGFAVMNSGGVPYSDARLHLKSALPDAVSRLASNQTPNSAAAWVFGELQGIDPGALAYSDKPGDAEVPPGTRLTPGLANNTAPSLEAPAAISGVIGDLTNPGVLVRVTDFESPAELFVWAESSNEQVVPVTNLVLTLLSNSTYRLSLAPVGVGYSDITVFSTDGDMTGRVALAYAASAPGRPGGVWHLGASDGSAGIALDPDYFWLADDENQILRLYPRLVSSLPLRQLDLTPFLDLPDIDSGLPREVDFEAATRSGDLLVWMGSHGHGATGEPRTNRTRLTATRLQGSGGESVLITLGHYDFLKSDFIDWDRLNRHGKGAGYYGLEASDADGVPPKAPDGSGLAIEGLTMIPGNTNAAYIAFRAPIVPATNRVAALIIPVLNLVSLAANGGPPGSSVFGEPIELDLYGRGIRSIEGDTKGFVLVGGPAGPAPGAYPQDFRLYTWNGDAKANAEQRTADLSGLNPEGIVSLPQAPWGEDSEVEVVSDNGTTVFYGDGVPAKALVIRNFKKCRSDWVKLGKITKPVPIIVSVHQEGSAATITWRSLKGETYRLQLTPDLNTGVWEDLPGDVVASGAYTTKTVNYTGRAGFYRVVLPATPG